MATDQIIIQVSGRDGRYVPVASFVAAMLNALTILKEVDTQISEQNQGSTEWRIKDVSYNSPLTAVFIGEPIGELNVVTAIVEASADGLEQLDQSPGVVPAFFSVRALEVSKKMVNVLNDGVERLVVQVPEYKAVVPTQRVAANVDELTQTYDELSTFEGKLEAVSIHGKRVFYVWDTFDGRISCRFGESELDKVVGLFGHRVSVYGRTRFSQLGKPLSIQVEEIEDVEGTRQPFDPRQFSAVDITGGVDAVAFVRELRDA